MFILLVGDWVCKTKMLLGHINYTKVIKTMQYASYFVAENNKQRNQLSQVKERSRMTNYWPYTTFVNCFSTLYYFFFDDFPLSFTRLSILLPLKFLLCMIYFPANQAGKKFTQIPFCWRTINVFRFFWRLYWTWKSSHRSNQKQSLANE